MPNPTGSIYQFLSTNGDGSGDINANGDYSVTPGEFYISPPPYHKAVLERMILEIEDTNGFASTDYGNITGALPNGVRIQALKGGVVQCEYDGGQPITTNAGWSTIMYDVDVKTWGPGNELLVGRFTFAKSGSPCILNGPDWRLRALLNDNLTGLVAHKFMVQGYYSN